MREEPAVAAAAAAVPAAATGLERGGGGKAGRAEAAAAVGLGGRSTRRLLAGVIVQGEGLELLQPRCAVSIFFQ